MIVVEGILAYMRVLTNMFHTFDIYMRTCLYVCNHDWGRISNSQRGDFSVFGYMRVCTNMFHTYNIYIRTCLYVYTYISVYIYFMTEGILATAQEDTSASSDAWVCAHMWFKHITFTHVHVCTYIREYVHFCIYIRTYLYIYISWLTVYQQQPKRTHQRLWIRACVHTYVLHI